MSESVSSRSNRPRWLACFGFANAADMSRATESLHRYRGAELTIELLPISTCQRHELFCLASDRLPRPPECTWLGGQADAALRLFQLAAGALSDIPGERAVARQVHAAWRAANRTGRCGRSLSALVRRAVQAGTLVREKVEQTAPIIELPDLVCDLVLNATRQDSDARVLLLGGGQVARSIHAAMGRAGVADIDWATRRPARSRGPTLTLHDAQRLLPRSRVVIAALADAPNLLHAAEGSPAAVSIDVSVPAAIQGARWTLEAIIHGAAARLEPQRQALRRAAHRLPALADQALAEVISPSVAPAARSIVQFRQQIVEHELKRLAPILATLPAAQAEALQRAIRHTAARCTHPLHETINQLARHGRANEAMTMIDHLLGSRVGWIDATVTGGTEHRSTRRAADEGAA